MKAVTYSSTGSSDVLHFGEREEPHPGPGEVRVRIHVSGVNPTDWKARQGSGEAELPRPQVPDQDGAGVVDEVGEGVTGLSVGDRVWVWDAAYQRPDGTARSSRWSRPVRRCRYRTTPASTWAHRWASRLSPRTAP